MTVFEILNFNRELLKRLSMRGFKLEDCRFIDLYSEYEQMYRNGDKVTYIVTYLSGKYNVSERKVWHYQTFQKRLHEPCSIKTPIFFAV